MTKLTKKKKQLLELVDPENTYSLEEAMTIFQTVKSHKFDESVDIALRLVLIQANLIKMLEAQLLFLIHLAKQYS